MKKTLSVIVIEDKETNIVMAEVILSDKVQQYDHAEFLVYGIVSPFFDGRSYFTPEEFGEIPCEVVLYNEDDEEIEHITGNITAHLKTWYTELKTDENGDRFQFSEEEVVNIFSEDRARGCDDICWMYKLRIPEGETLTLTSNIEPVGNGTSDFSGTLEVHARRDEYANRGDLYQYPDEPFRHIDIDTDLWEELPLELSEGVYNIYVCPSVRHDLSLLTVFYTGGISGAHSGYFKSIDYSGLGL